jgi:hypothetical protein
VPQKSLACRIRCQAGQVVEKADETVHRLSVLRDSEIIDVQKLRPLIAEAGELRAIFAKSYGTARRNHSGDRKSPNPKSPNHRMARNRPKSDALIAAGSDRSRTAAVERGDDRFQV